jgi:predicted dehydrogenase
MTIMKTAICGVWHVHASDYTKKAMALTEVVGVYDENPVWRKDFCAKFGLKEFETLDQLLASDADGVIVCTSTDTHADTIIKIAKAGKDIFTEKVLALTEEDCERVEKAVSDNGVKFVISLFQKYGAGQRTLKSVVDSGELGKINYLRFRNCHSGSTANWLPSHFYNAAQCGGGAMIDWGAHGMYLTHWILGLPETASSVFTLAHRSPKNTDGVEDNAVTVMGFPGGAIAVNETGFVSGVSPVVLEVFGENGFVRMENGRVTLRVGSEETELPLPEACPAPIVQFLTGNILPGCGIEEAKALTRMMEMAYSSK